MKDMNITILIILIILLLILIVINFIVWRSMNRPINKNAKCCNCRSTDTDDFREVRCRNKKSKHYGTMVDDYEVCDRWKGLIKRNT